MTMTTSNDRTISMTTRDGVEIEVGNWIVSADGPDKDAGQVTELHDDGTATVAWEAGAAKVRDRIATECDVYEDRRAALVAAFGEERVASTYGI